MRIARVPQVVASGSPKWWSTPPSSRSTSVSDSGSTSRRMSVTLPRFEKRTAVRGGRSITGRLRLACRAMSMPRFDHVGVVVDDIDAVAEFFVALGFERDGGMLVEGEIVDRINGLDGV